MVLKLKSKEPFISGSLNDINSTNNSTLHVCIRINSNYSNFETLQN